MYLKCTNCRFIRIQPEERSTPSRIMTFLYEVCSLTSSAETADDLPGPGRLLGNLYSFIGRKFENRVGSVVVRMGYGPTVSALKIQRIEEDQSLCYSVRRKKLRKNCKLLAQYLRYTFLQRAHHCL